MKNIIIVTALLLAGCIFVVPADELPKDTPEVETPVKCKENPEGPWYSPEFLRENAELHSDMYFCSNYYVHKQKHCTVPILCGSEDGECGITACECVCHEGDRRGSRGDSGRGHWTRQEK
jgi:hypothetical protein